MNNPKFLTLALLALALPSCAGKGNLCFNPDKYPMGNVEGNAYVLRNGDNYAKKGLGYSYAECMRPGKFEDVEAYVGAGKDALLFLHQDRCSSCQAIHDNFLSVVIESGMEIFSYDFSSDTASMVAELNKLPTAHPAYAGTMQHYATPTCYLLRGDEKALLLPVYQVASEFEEYFKNLLNLPYIFTFRTYSAFVSFTKDHDCLALLDDDMDYFYGNVYSSAIASEKYTAIIEKGHLSEADRSSYSSLFGEDNLATFVGGKADKKAEPSVNPDSASKLIKEYYA